MKKYFVLLLLLIVFAGCNDTHTLQIKDMQGNVSAWEYVHYVTIDYSPWYSSRGIWEIRVRIQHPTCGSFLVSESGSDLQKVYKAINERIICLNTCK